MITSPVIPLCPSLFSFKDNGKNVNISFRVGDKFKADLTVTGHGTTSGNRATWGRNIRVAEMREAMGINWMNRDELSQAIP